MYLRIVLLIILLTILAYLITDLPHGLGEVDLIQYYAASKLLLSGGNPYDPKSIFEVERGLAPILSKPTLLWNPPFIFPFVLPFSLFSFEVFRLIWIPLTIVLFLSCYNSLSKQIRATQTSFRSVLFLATFHPIFSHIYYGQSSIIILVGLTIFLIYTGAEGTRAQHYAGAGLALTLIKPHLLYLLYLWWLLESCRERRLVQIFSFVSTAIFLALIPLLFDHAIWQRYYLGWQVPPIYWQTPTVGSWLQLILGIDSAVLRITPTIIVTLWFLVGWISKRKNVDNLLLLIPLSLLTSPYGWGYDQILLLPSLIFLLKAKKIVIPIALGAIVILAGDLLSYQYLIFYTAAVLLLMTKESYLPTGIKTA